MYSRFVTPPVVFSAHLSAGPCDFPGTPNGRASIGEARAARLEALVVIGVLGLDDDGESVDLAEVLRQRQP